MELFQSFILLTLLVAVYFLPLIMAVKRNHRNTAPIAMLNLLLGWTVLGWIGALIWSLTANTESEPAR
ncbi:superinfection immunity protein [Aeromonas veronii]|uniref:superinfection immunity protein n=1 Tax=Aeromonas veronii TaxID=654 RepID=UPI00355ACDFA